MTKLDELELAQEKILNDINTYGITFYLNRELISIVYQKNKIILDMINKEKSMRDNYLSEYKKLYFSFLEEGMKPSPAEDRAKLETRHLKDEYEILEKIERNLQNEIDLIKRHINQNEGELFRLSYLENKMTSNNITDQ